MTDKPTTIQEYLNLLLPDRRQAIEKVRQVVLNNLPKGYQEVFEWGMLSYVVPLSVYPDTYNKKPYMYAALGNQKNYMALYLMAPYNTPSLKDKLKSDFTEAGKKLNMGASCIRFKKLEDLPLDVIGKNIASIPMQEHIAFAKSLREK